MPATQEPPLSPEVAGAKGLREGWTTGTCASAAAKAATQWLVEGTPPHQVEVALPSGQRVGFPVTDVDAARPHRCAVVKDAGDDPDVTHGAHITAEAAWPVAGAGTEDGLELRGGDGVGTITLPGLGLAVGAPAINPVPRRMITQAVRDITPDPLVVTISVPGGQAMAAKTSNDRLGIVGGISILGTTGIVRPFSTASYRASVVQQVDVAGAQGQRHLVLATGSRSDRAAQRLLPDLAPVCFVEVGDFTGIALRRAVTAGIDRVTWVGMAGKIAKLAAGVIEAATATATARHFAEVCLAHDCRAPLDELCRRAARACESHVKGALAVEVIMVDFEGEEVIARG